MLANLLKHQTGQLLNRTSLAKKVQVTVQTISRWIATLERFYFCFQVTPWSHNISRSLIKEPKIYLWDWSQIEDEGAKFENFIASHLYKAIHFWNDIGIGDFSLHFLRDKDKKEVDFLISKNQKAWALIEVKVSDKKLSKYVKHFQEQSQATKALQVLKNMEYVHKDCFKSETPLIVPAKTFLSQLV